MNAKTRLSPRLKLCGYFAWQSQSTQSGKDSYAECSACSLDSCHSKDPHNRPRLQLAETGLAWIVTDFAQGSSLANAASDPALWGTGLAKAASDQSPPGDATSGQHPHSADNDSTQKLTSTFQQQPRRRRSRR